MSVGVVLASAGRPTELSQALASVLASVDVDVHVVVSVPTERDLPRLPADTRVSVVTGVRGSSAQRNAGVHALPARADLVFFFDDDALVKPDYLRNAVRYFRDHAHVVGMTGYLLADGAQGREIAYAEAERLLREEAPQPAMHPNLCVKKLYGCNLGFRRRYFELVRFDERLPLYGWLEDVDFSAELARHGTLAKVGNCLVVHRGADSGGRMAHRRYGFSQVVNPYYVWRKGNLSTRGMLRYMLRPLAKNLILSTVGPVRGWRRRRLAGNAVGLAHLASRQVDPEFAVHIQD